MTSLFDLPNELLLEIYTNVEPDDLVNFAVTCKQSHALAEDALQEHRALQENYGKIVCEGDLDWKSTLSKLLRDLFQDRRPPHYVRELDLSAEWLGWEKLNYPWGMAESGLLEIDMDEIFLSPGPSTFAFYLFPRLRNLRKLSYVPNEQEDPFLIYVSRVAKSYSSVGDGLLALPFQNLRTVLFIHPDTEDAMDYKWLFYFSRIPSIRSVSGNMVGHNDDPYDDSYFDKHPRPGLMASNTSSLRMATSSIGPTALNTLLSGMSKLRNFEYDNGGGSIGYHEWDPKAMFVLLLEHTKNSLESLRLTDTTNSGIDESDYAKVSLKEFTVLKTLLTDWDALLPDPDVEENDALNDEELSQGFYSQIGDQPEPVVDVSEFLPDSLEELSLRCCGENWFDILSTFLRRKENRFPKFQKLEFSIGGNYDHAVASEKIIDLKGIGKKYGVYVAFEADLGNVF